MPSVMLSQGMLQYYFTTDCLRGSRQLTCTTDVSPSGPSSSL
jgi:hypothetical protein